MNKLQEIYDLVKSIFGDKPSYHLKSDAYYPCVSAVMSCSLVSDDGIIINSDDAFRITIYDYTKRGGDWWVDGVWTPKNGGGGKNFVPYIDGWGVLDNSVDFESQIRNRIEQILLFAKSDGIIPSYKELK